MTASLPNAAAWAALLAAGLACTGCPTAADSPLESRSAAGPLPRVPDSDSVAERAGLGRRLPGPCVGWGDGEGNGTLDGLVDARIDFAWEGDRLRSWTVHYFGDEAPGAHAAFVYEGDRRVGERYDCDGAGESFEEETTWVLDGRGRKRLGLLRKLPNHARLCDPADAAPDEASTDLRLRSPERHDWAAELAALGVGEPPAYDAIASFRWQDDRLVAEAWDHDLDGSVDEVLRFFHDRWGNLQVEMHDDGPDGRADVEIRYGYDCWGAP